VFFNNGNARDFELNQMKKQYDVVILGGGLAGLTLSLQLKQEKKDISILVLEQRKDNAPVAGHKVGESTVELGTYYLREVLGLKKYLDEYQLPKHGLRFFFSPKHKNKIEERVELGPRDRLPVPSHQIDRGTFENELVYQNTDIGNEVLLGARVKNVELNEGGHEITYKHEGEEITVGGRWVVDATGRGSFLKRKLGFQKELDHPINASWFRVKGEVDVNDWGGDEQWRDFLKPGLRRLGTVHLMDKGYWVWLIPLSSGNTSIGIVADPRFHPFEDFNTLEKAKNWLSVNEPQAFANIFHPTCEVVDFLFLKHYAHHSGRLYSEDRWAVVGESGAFLDPFYSPGTDFIALANSWAASLILRDLNNEDIFIHARVYEQAHLGLFDNWIPVYKNKYQLMGRTQIMVIKIFWDWAIYWSFFTFLFTNNALTDITLLKKLFGTDDSLGAKLQQINGLMQQLFIDWGEHDTEDFTNRYIDPFDLHCLKTFHKEMEVKHQPDKLMEKLEKNINILEKLSAEIFRHVSYQVNETSLDMPVNPYKMILNDPEKSSKEGIEVDPEIEKDVSTMWFYKK